MMTSVSVVAPYLLPLVAALAPLQASGSTVSKPNQLTSAVKHSMPRGVHSAHTEPQEKLGTDVEHTTSSGSVDLQGTTIFSTFQQVPWLEKAVGRAAAYSSLRDGWKGEGSVAPSIQTISDASELLTQFATEMPEIAAPMISADEDGSICLYWRDGDMMATISVFGDGTFATYAEGFADPVRSDSDVIGEPLPPALIATMTGAVVLSAIVS